MSKCRVVLEANVLVPIDGLRLRNHRRTRRIRSAHLCQYTTKPSFAGLSALTFDELLSASNSLAKGVSAISAGKGAATPSAGFLIFFAGDLGEDAESIDRFLVAAMLGLALVLEAARAGLLAGAGFGDRGDDAAPVKEKASRVGCCDSMTEPTRRDAVRRRMANAGAKAKPEIRADQ